MLIVITAADLVLDDQIGDQNGPVVTAVTVLENGRVQFKLDSAQTYTLDAEGVMEVWRNPRNADALPVDDVGLVDEAITYGAVTGSRGGNMTIQEVDGSVRFAKMDRVAQHAAGWRVRDHHNPEMIGKVFVISGRPGRYTSHAAS